MNTSVSELPIGDFWYDLPDDRIARFPVPGRDSAKLLTYCGGNLGQDHFFNLSAYLSADTLLIGNETRVVQARFVFQKPGGAVIELFCLSPAQNGIDFQQAFATVSAVEWQCLVGNSKRWKEGALEEVVRLGETQVLLKAERIARQEGSSTIRFSWCPAHFSFSEIMEAAGQVPLPPYLNRPAVASDKTDYQTLFARFDGSVAAPTASLHFTDRVMKSLRQKGIDMSLLTLHVGAGTFKPVSSDKIGDHEMHAENMIVGKELIERLLHQSGSPVIPVGTTSMRALESLFWIGQMLEEAEKVPDVLHVAQWYPYQDRPSETISTEKALNNILDFMDQSGRDHIRASTSLMIAPGYTFRISTGLITNFHQPGSTLLLLVAALIGPKWKDAYNYALGHDFRFLSYGDSCLFLPQMTK